MFSALIKRQIFWIYVIYFQAGSYLNQLGVGAVSQPAGRMEAQTEPCGIDSSFLFTREDVKPGSVVMKLPTYNGERWALVETDAQGYLTLTTKHGGQTWVVVSQSPDLEAISQVSFQQELIISDVNEHAPAFDPHRSFSFNVSEATIAGTSVYSLRQIATDSDTTGQVSFYSLEPYLEAKLDGRSYFHISDDGNHIVLSQAMDYEALQASGTVTFKLNLSATDNGTPETLASYRTLTIHVIDVDDQGPAFVYPDCQRVDHFCILPYFQAAMKCGFQGQLSLYPGPAVAIDRDTQNYSVFYSLSRVEPSKFTERLQINKQTGEIQVARVPCASDVHELMLTLTATENSPLKHSTSANIQVKLLDNLVFPNMGWNFQVPADNMPTANSSLSLVLFLVAVFGFIIIGCVMAFVALRISHKRKQISKVGIGQVPHLDDCPVYQSDISKTTACFQTCNYNGSPQLSHSSIDSESTAAKLTFSPIQSIETISMPIAMEQEPQEMWTAFRTASNNPFVNDALVFNSSPSQPGRPHLTSFYDPNSSFESMKHERRIEGSRQVGRLKLTFTNVVPDCVKSATQKVRFDANSFNQSSV